MTAEMRIWFGKTRAPALAMLMVLALAAWPALMSTDAETAVPEPGPGEAVVQLYVGGARTGPASIGPAPSGFVFGLFTANPSASIGDNDGFVDTTPPGPQPLFTCTSDADGDCSFVVPMRPGTPGTDGVPQGTRLWAVPVSAPDGEYYANPYWQTAPLTNTNQQSLRHVFQTPALVAGQVYRSGSEWITDPGLQTSPQQTVPEFTRRTASGGVWPLSRINPELPPQCGLDVALVVDLSSSVAAADAIEDLKASMSAFIDALHGTPSQVALFTFGTDSPASGYGPNTPLMSVATTSEADRVKSLYEDWDNPPTNYTNWGRGLAAVAETNSPDTGSEEHFDLAVLITDGNPTVYGPSPLSSSGQPRDRGSGYTRFRELGNGNASANLLKSQGDTRARGRGGHRGIRNGFRLQPPHRLWPRRIRWREHPGSGLLPDA